MMRRASDQARDVREALHWPDFCRPAIPARDTRLDFGPIFKPGATVAIDMNSHTGPLA